MRSRLPALAVATAVVLASIGCAPIPLPRDTAYQASDADVSVMRIVHGSLVLGVGRTRLVVDPWFHSSVLHRQAEPLGILPDKLPPAAAVLLTQGGADHFDDEALAALAKTVPRALAPVPLRERLEGLGFVDVRGLAPWERTTLDDVEITAMPSSGSPGQVGWVVAAGGARVYLAGDTRPFDGLVDVATAFPHLDVAFLPIGGRRIFGVLRDMTPEQAADATAVLRPKTVIPIDYGAQGFAPAVWYAGDPVERFRSALEQRGLGDRLVALQPGESWHRF